MQSFMTKSRRAVERKRKFPSEKDPSTSDEDSKDGGRSPKTRNPKRKKGSKISGGEHSSVATRYSTRSTATVPELSKTLCRGNFLF